MQEIKDIRLLSFSILITLAYACSTPAKKNNLPVQEATKTKPVSTFQDTLKISSAAAIFYKPDSLQLKKIKLVTEEKIFEASQHEYFYQQRNAHIFFKKYWPQLKIVDAENMRYFLFVKKDKRFELIDLDKTNDAYGLYVFDTIKPPLQIDMTNVESQVPGYFSKLTD